MNPYAHAGPTHVGRFQIREQLRTDSHSTSYAALDPRNGHNVVVTLMHRDPDADASLRRYHRRSLERQLEVAQRLAIPGILGVIAISDEEQQDYIVTEALSDALPLPALWTNGRPVPTEQALRIAIGTAGTLTQAHRVGIVHGDLQPRNVVIYGEDAIKLTGFQPERATDDDGADRPHGSVVYLAPEQVRGGPATPATDIFSLAVVLYEMLTGEHPFMSNIVPAIGQRIAGKAHVPVTLRQAGLPTILDRILDRALKKHPAGRYQSMLDFAGDLALVLDDIAPPSEAEPDEVRLERIRELSFFEEFLDTEMMEVLHASLWQDFNADEVIVNEGDAGESFFILVQGEVDVRKGAALIETLVRGDCFGEIGFITNRERTASIVATTAVQVMEIRARLIDRISLPCQIRFQRAFLDIMANRLTRATSRLAELSLKLSARQ
ncbi:MAG: serine/threonine-protein kinase [Pseudomonadota bacterium]